MLCAHGSKPNMKRSEPGATSPGNAATSKESKDGCVKKLSEESGATSDAIGTGLIGSRRAPPIPQIESAPHKRAEDRWKKNVEPAFVDPDLGSKRATEVAGYKNRA